MTVLQRRLRGFTLIEMMVAIAVVAIAALAVFFSNSNVLNRQHSLEEYTLAHWAVMDQVAEFHLQRLTEPNQEFRRTERTQVIQSDKVYEVVRSPQTTSKNGDLQALEFTIFLVTDGEVAATPIDRIVTYVEDL